MKARDHCHLQGKAQFLADELHTSIEGPRLKLVVWRPCNLRQVAATKPFRTWSLGMHHVRGSLDLHLHCTLTLSEGCKFARHTRIDLSSHFSAIWRFRLSISSYSKGISIHNLHYRLLQSQYFCDLVRVNILGLHFVLVSLFGVVRYPHTSICMLPLNKDISL